MPTPVHVVSGFLGAGKTTALQHQLALRADREVVAVVVNDFGESSFDAGVLAVGAGARIQEIPGGCVCCTAPEGFVDALRTLLDEVDPDRIFVEPTGLARPADLLDTIRRGPLASRLEPGPLVVLVDPHQLDRGGTLLERQAEAADVIVANRIDLATPEELVRFRAWVEALWPGPLRVIETDHGVLDRSAFEWPEGTGPRRALARADADRLGVLPSTDGYEARSWAFGPEVVFSRDRLVDLLARAATERAGAPLARLKGVLRTRDGTWRVEVAGDQVHERPTDYRRDSRLDVILQGRDLEGAFSSIDAWLDEARATPSELVVDPEQLELVRPDGTRVVLDRSALIALPNGVADVAPLVPGRSGAAARLAEVLAVAGPVRDAEAIVVAADGFATPAVPASALAAGLLVHSLGDGPLPDSQGGPFRLLIPGDAGPGGPCANVKGVVRIVFRAPPGG